MATLVILIGLALLGILAVLSVIAYTQSQRRAEADERIRHRFPTRTKLQENETKGQRAEALVQHHRLGPLPDSLYTKYHSLYIPRVGNPQRSTEIDHVVVSPFGVFVVETKSWQGRILGRPDDEQWRQELGTARNTHRNPIKQNDLHVRSLISFLELSDRSVCSIVCFEGENCEFGNSMPNNVVHDTDLYDYIASFETEILDTEAVMRANWTLSEHISGPDHARYRAIHEAEIDRRRREQGE